MIPSITAVRLTGARNRAELPLLVLGPSLGTSTKTLWNGCSAALRDSFDLIAWDLPGHGHNRVVPDEPFTMAELATGVLRVVEEVLAERGEVGGTFLYAGVSVGGAVGLQLLLDRPERMNAAVLVCTGAKIGSESMWAGRIGQVSVSGTAVMVTPSAERWFGPGHRDRSPEVGSALLESLQQTENDGYIAVCGALAGFDVRDRLAEIGVPVLAVAGSHDVSTPPESLRTIADGVAHGRFVQLEGVAHLAPADAPAAVVALLRQHFLGEEPALLDDIARDFEEFTDEYASRDVWSRPGLDRRSRHLIALAALIARGHHEELATHLSEALRNGVSENEIKELFLQSSLYCGASETAGAYRRAQQLLDAARQE